MSSRRRRVLGMIIAGGEGTRLQPLTRERAKPAVPFGGKYRLIDFVLSNFVNSDIFAIYVLVQFKSQSLIEHIAAGWQFGGVLPDHFVSPVPAQMRLGQTWYQGTADAVFQNLNLIENFAPDVVAVFGADHIYRLDIRQMIDFHEERDADVTVATIPVRREEAGGFGVLAVDEERRVTAFVEKPEDPPTIPGRPGWALASMGNYIFKTSYLLEALTQLSRSSVTGQDFGQHVLPQRIESGRTFAYDFTTNRLPGEAPTSAPYWRDVGTVDAYFAASMDLCDASPALNLYNAQWPVRSVSSSAPPAKFVFDIDGRRGSATNSLISEGCLIEGANVLGSVLGHSVRIESGAEVEECVILDGTRIGAGARLRRVIVDKNCQIPAGMMVGLDPAHDRERFATTESGLVILPKGWRAA